MNDGTPYFASIAFWWSLTKLLEPGKNKWGRSSRKERSMTVSNAFVLAHGSVNSFTIYHSKSGDFYYYIPSTSDYLSPMLIYKWISGFDHYLKAGLNKIVSLFIRTSFIQIERIYRKAYKRFPKIGDISNIQLCFSILKKKLSQIVPRWMRLHLRVNTIGKCLEQLRALLPFNCDFAKIK